MLLSCFMQGVELPSAGISCEVEQNIRDREETQKLTSLHQTKEAEGKERGSGDEEESDLGAMLEEAEVRPSRMKAEEELKNQQARAAEMDNEKVNDN